MKKLRRHLDIFVNEIDANIKISDSSEPGEGEHKMMKYISENLIGERKKIAIYGLDADLIMLSLRNIKSQNIVLLRDNTFNSKLKESERTFTYLEISQLKQAIHMELGSKIEDYIMICFLLGNDFLEHIPSLQIKENGMTVLLKHYKKAVGADKSLVSGSDINLEVLYEILINIGKSEDYFYKNVYSVYQNSPSKRQFKDAELLEEIEKNGKVFFYNQDYIKFNEPGYKKRYYAYYGVAQSDIKTLCRDYLEGLYWILLYYDNHRHDNWSWYYEHHAIPFASDLAQYLREHMSEFIEYIAKTSSLKKTTPCTEIEQLCMVLPRESLLNVIEPNLKVKMERIFRTDSSDLEQMYPKKISVDILYKEYMWQSKIFIEPFKKRNFEIIRDLILQEYII
jgi:5'-3' exoribonuclease 2